MSYLPLGSKVTTAALGGAQSLSPGNWINSFDIATLGAKVSNYECFHIAVTAAPAGKTLIVYINNRIGTACCWPGTRARIRPSRCF